MSYHPTHASAHHPSFLNASLPLAYAHGHGANASQTTNTSLLGSGISSHSFPMAPSPNNGTPQPQPPQPPQQPPQAQSHSQPQQPAVAAHAPLQTQQQQAQVAQQASSSVPPGVPDAEGLIAPPSMPLELDFDNLESASNYMHTYALSQGFDIRIQWSANNQTRICWSCYRGGFPESLNPDGTPNTKKRPIPKDKERRKRGSLKIGCPFRVQCTKNWKSGKMELRILEGRHKHAMETDRENLPSQVRRIKNQRKAHESPGAPQAGNAAANAVAQAANLSATPTPATTTAAATTQGKARASNAASAGRNASQPAVRRAQQPRQQTTMTPTPDLLVNAAGPSAHLMLATPSTLSTPTPANGAYELGSDLVLTNGAMGSDAAGSGPKVSFERQMLNLLGVYDRSDAAGRAILDAELDAMRLRAEARLQPAARKKRKAPGGDEDRTRVNGLGSPMRPQSVPVVSTPVTAAPGVGMAQPPSSGKGSARCSNCKEYGHNRRRCPLG